EIAVQHERIEQQFGASGVITLEAQDAARLSAALRDFASGGNGAALEPVPSGNTLVAKGPREQSRTAGFYGCRISLLPSRLSEVVVQIEEHAARSGITASLLAGVGSGVAVVRFTGSARSDDAFVVLANWLRDAVRRAGGWVVFDALPAHLKERIDPWDVDAP